ncbi:MAG TPA: hypothetical protein VF559_08250 [Caulobacteraceae bacterium]
MALVSLGNVAVVAASSGDNVAREMLAQLVSPVCSAVAGGALLRLAFRDEHPGDPEFEPGRYGLQWRKPEWRLLGIFALLLFLFVLAILFVAFISMLFGVVGALTGALSPTSADAGAVAPQVRAGGALLALTFFFGCGIVWLRLILGGPATVARKRIMLFQTWPLTKGQFWHIFAAWALINVPVGFLALLLAALVAALVGSPTPNTATVGQLVLIGLLPGAIAGFVLAPLNFGLAAYLYRGLRQGPDTAPEDIGV